MDGKTQWDAVVEAGKGGMAAFAPDGCLCLANDTFEQWFPALPHGKAGTLARLPRELQSAVRRVSQESADAPPAVMASFRRKSAESTPFVVWRANLPSGPLAVVSISPEGTVADASGEMTQEELNRFAYFASHDLQEPLRTVTAYLQLLRKALPDPQREGQAGQFLDRALQGADRMKGLVYGLLEYTRASTRPTEPAAIDLETPVRDALAALVEREAADIREAIQN